MEGNVLGIVTMFIGVMILLVIGTQILGNVSIECDGLEAGTGYNWTQNCMAVQETSGGGYELLTIIGIVLAAVGILFVIRYMS